MEVIQKANMMQIAKHCGVSLKTVSRVLNHPEQVSPKTKEMVRQSMEQCGFQVNLLAKGLKQNRTNIIIVFLDKHNGDYMNLWRSEMLKHLFRYSSKIGLKIIVSPSDYHGFKEDETDGFNLLSSGIADGAILLEYMAGDQRIKYLKRTGTPYVVLGQPKEQDIPAVSLDNFDVGFKGGRYLKEKGFEKICYLTNDQNIYSTKLRVKGFLEAVPKGRIIYGVKDAKSAYEKTKELLSQEEVDCIFTNGDNRFLGIYKAAYECGRKIPEDLGVLSTDNGPINEDACPALSSLDQDFKKLAQECITMLQSLLEKQQAPELSISPELSRIQKLPNGHELPKTQVPPTNQQIFLPSAVIERESTRCARCSNEKL